MKEVNVSEEISEEFTERCAVDAACGPEEFTECCAVDAACGLKSFEKMHEMKDVELTVNAVMRTLVEDENEFLRTREIILQRGLSEA